MEKEVVKLHGKNSCKTSWKTSEGRANLSIKFEKL